MTVSDVAHLPYIDEHAVDVHCDPDNAWDSLLETLEAAFSGSAASAYARAVGCTDRTASGPRPLVAGSTIPGFRVVSADPGRELVLAGRHRFSTYALIFRLDRAGPGHSRLRAESRAAFPGITGAAYRLLVVGTGGHVLGVRRLLSGVARRCDRANALPT